MKRLVSGGLPCEMHIDAHYIQNIIFFTELLSLLDQMPDIYGLIGLHPNALSRPPTFYHSPDRYARYVCRTLLRASAQQLYQSGQVVLSGTLFKRK
jgi:hypothetical protein